jgi:membrane protease YdiL (CAAX protease family)
MGSLGEPFEVRVFLFRFLAGAILGTLYLTRGLGICVYTHAFYNVGLLLIRSAGG